SFDENQVKQEPFSLPLKLYRGDRRNFPVLSASANNVHYANIGIKFGWLVKRQNTGFDEDELAVWLQHLNITDDEQQKEWKFLGSQLGNIPLQLVRYGIYVKAHPGSKDAPRKFCDDVRNTMDQAD